MKRLKPRLSKTKLPLPLVLRCGEARCGHQLLVGPSFLDAHRLVRAFEEEGWAFIPRATPSSASSSSAGAVVTVPLCRLHSASREVVGRLDYPLLLRCGGGRGNNG